jgi:hypothetical protein
MRDYGKVYTQFWSSQTIRGMSDDAKMLAVYLLSSTHTTLTGVFRLPDGYASEDLEWTTERVSKGFAELFRKGFANRCETTKWVWIRKHLQWNQPENPNQRKAAAKIAYAIPDECTWKPDFMRLYEDKLGMEHWEKPEPLPNPFETLSKPEAVTETEAVTEAGEKTLASDHFEIAKPKNGELIPLPASPAGREKKPPESNPELQAACKATWDSYSAAYRTKYGVAPVRNAPVNAQIKAIVQRLGYQDSPHVAAFYLTHGGAYYAGRMHDAGTLLRDCEKLRTEWATGRKVTTASARQADRTQTNITAMQDAMTMLQGAPA